MTLKINIEKLNKEYIDTGYLFEEKEKINNLIKKVDNNNILISGFRGAGKSHFIDSIIKSYSKDSTKIFIKQNVNNYTEYNLLLRGLIRALFEELDMKKNSGNNENNEDVQKLLKDLEKLYKNTFYNVSEIFSTSKQETLLDSIKMEFSVSKLVELLIPIVSYVIVIFGAMKMNDILKTFLVFILSILTWIKYEKQYNRERTKISKEEYSTLYDDEIAEYRLFNLLKRLNDAGIKVIFVFDEVDKIENGDKLNKFYSDLKSLLLLEECSSLVIAGQSTYYEFEKSIFQEDSLLNNIFTTLIHISIVPTEFIKENIKTIFIDEHNPEIVENYIYYLLFESSKIPRNLNNLLLNHVELSTGRVTYFESEKLPSIYREIVELIESYLVLLKKDNVKKSVIDVVEIYSFIWMKKLLLFRNSKDLSFDKIDIFSQIQEKDTGLIATHLNRAFDFFWGELTQSTLQRELGVIISSSETESKEYVWKYSDDNFNASELDIEVLHNFNKYLELVNSSKVIEQLNTEETNRIRRLRNLIAHSRKVDINELEKSQKFLRTWQPRTFENLVGNIVENYLKTDNALGAELLKNSSSDIFFDFVIDLGYRKIYIESKAFTRNGSKISASLDWLKDNFLNISNNPLDSLIIYVYTDGNFSLKNQFNQILEKNHEMRDRIFLIEIKDFSEIDIRNGLKLVLEDTIIVSSKKEGFETFTKENRWYSISIKDSKIPYLKYIAAYVGRDVSAITHVAKISQIVESPYVVDKKLIDFEGEAWELDNKIDRGDNPNLAIQGIKYTNFNKLLEARAISDL